MAQAIGGYVMAFDFGLRHIGVALGQSLTGTARGVATLKAKNGKPDWRMVAKLLQEYAPQHLVVGWPLNMDDSTSDMAERAETFARTLGERSGLAVHLHDERLSSREAKASFEHARRMGQASSEHELAACLILAGWLEATAQS
jgi:putative Holliday junction resolvase